MGELNYTTINHAARKKLGISLNEYVLCDSIYHLANNPTSAVPGWCYASKNTLADNLDLDRSTVIRSINRLIERGLLLRDESTSYLKTTQIWFEEVLLTKSGKTPQNVRDNFLQGVAKRHRVSQNATSGKTPHNNNNNILNNNTVNHLNNKIDKQLNSVTVCVSTKKCGNCAKCSISPCTPKQLWEMAMNENVWIDDVKRKQDDILRMKESDELKKYKVKTMIGTLRTWIRLGIKKGYIREMDEIQRLLLPDEHPDIKEKMKHSISIAKQKGLI